MPGPPALPLGAALPVRGLPGYDGTGTPDCILCDDTEVDTAEDVPVDVYVAGCFDPEKVTVADGYTITQADKDKLRTYSIAFKAATPAP